MKYHMLNLGTDYSPDDFRRLRGHFASYEAVRARVAGGEDRSAEIDDEPLARRAQVRRRSDRSGLRYPKHQPYHRAEARQISDEEWGRLSLAGQHYRAGTMRDHGVYMTGKLPDGVEYRRDPDVVIHGGHYAKYLDNRKAA